MDPIQLRTHRLNALAREDLRTGALLAVLRDSPSVLLQHLMDEHGWAAHEALGVILQQQEAALKQTAAQVLD